MNKTGITLTILIIISLLSACSTPSQAAVPTGKVTDLSTEAELLVGTYKLENTNLAVNSDQARQLLPLWQALLELSTSNIAASAEINAVVDQIKVTMTDQQIASITTMNLSQDDLTTLNANLGASGAQANSAKTTSGSSAQFQGGAGAAGAGGPPASMGGGMPVQEGISTTGQTQASATQSSASPSTAVSNKVPPALIKALIDLLQKKTG